MKFIYQPASKIKGSKPNSSSSPSGLSGFITWINQHGSCLTVLMLHVQIVHTQQSFVSTRQLRNLAHHDQLWLTSVWRFTCNNYPKQACNITGSCLQTTPAYLLLLFDFILFFLAGSQALVTRYAAAKDRTVLEHLMLQINRCAFAVMIVLCIFSLTVLYPRS